MKEACIVCPQNDNAGNSLQHVRHYAELALCKAFGGCTAVHAKGAWVDPKGKLVTEPVWQLIAAYDPSEANDHALEQVARYVGTEGKQQAVYVRYASGDVQILDMAQAQAKAA